MTLDVNIRKQLNHFELSTIFSCKEGELTAIVGPSGAGKTTLIRLIAGLDSPDHGTIKLKNTVWADMENGHHVPTHKRKIGMVFQGYTLFPHMTIRQNITFSAPNTEEVNNLMKTFGIHHLRNERPSNISGGERQRAAFCQALARQPELLLLDEPFSALDVGTRTFLCNRLSEFKKDLNIPIIHVTHDLKEADQLGDTVIAVENGCISPGWISHQNTLHQPLTPSTILAYS